MTRRRQQKAPPLIDLRDILLRPVNVKRDGVATAMHPFEATYEKCAQDALGGNVRACIRFIKACLKEGLIDRPQEPYDDHQYVVRIPKDWDDGEFMQMYDRLGPPPWPGERDGLTNDERERRKLKAKQRRRSRR